MPEDITSSLLQTLQQLNSTMERIEQKLDGPVPDVLTTKEACELLRFSRATLDRRMKDWIQGVHWWRDGSSLRFDRALLQDWQLNREDPLAHQRAIALRQKQKLSNQKRPAKRSS
ncbi:MAG: hypothetical protein AAFY26_21050 [Cyanobacteria bacterium J06638_22]